MSLHQESGNDFQGCELAYDYKNIQKPSKTKSELEEIQVSAFNCFHISFGGIEFEGGVLVCTYNFFSVLKMIWVCFAFHYCLHFPQGELSGYSHFINSAVVLGRKFFGDAWPTRIMFQDHVEAYVI